MSELISRTNIKEELFKNYTVIPNWIFDGHFAVDEIAVISYMASKPIEWKYRKVEIQKTQAMSLSQAELEK